MMSLCGCASTVESSTDKARISHATALMQPSALCAPTYMCAAVRTRPWHQNDDVARKFCIALSLALSMITDMATPSEQGNPAINVRESTVLLADAG